MKTLVVMCLSLYLSSHCVFADGAKDVSATKVPATVKDAFKAKYADAKLRAWETEDDEYMAMFTLKGVKYEASFSKEGKWLETGSKVKFNDLPQVIKDALAKSEYKAWKVSEVAKIDTPEMNGIYEIEVRKGKECYGLHFDSSGKLIKKENENAKE